MSDRKVENGSFSKSFAERKRWKLNEGLQRVLLEFTDAGDKVLDVGAGVGEYVKWLRSESRPAWGVDGIESIEEISHGVVSQVDLTVPGVCDKLNEFAGDGYQLAMCIEVGEHIPSSLLRDFVTNLGRVKAQNLLVSWAVPGQRGRDHVSCRTPEWVANALGQCNWTLDEFQTRELRRIAGSGWDHKLLLFY